MERWERRADKLKARKGRMPVHGLRYVRTVTQVIVAKAKGKKGKKKRGEYPGELPCKRSG